MRKKYYAGFVLSLFLLLSITNCITGLEGSEGVNKNLRQYNNAYRYNCQGWIYVHVEGEPYDRGFQYGYLLADEIVDLITRWSNTVHKMPVLGGFTGSIGSARYNKTSERWWDFLKTRSMRVFWPYYPEEYQQEIKGIADGVAARGNKIFGREITYEDILTSNQMYETMQHITNPSKGVHPLKTFLNLLREIIPGLDETDENNIISTVLSQPPTDHCSGFIATGDATTNGQIVISQETFPGATSWWASFYVFQRWNVILDITPADGYRLMMSTAPGYIWSDQNYYQNEKGVVFIDTTHAVQGPWMRTGLPLSIRTRKAAQYAQSIDDVVYHLKYDSNGVWPAIWLIGDTKTGEIARFEQGTDRYAIWRTTDGFYWSANNIMDPKIRGEQLRLQAITKGRLYHLFHIIFKTAGYEYYTREYRPAPRDLKFEELGDKYYGEIDVEIVKKIMSTPPIAGYASDCKMTDSNLLEHNGMWAFWGNPQGIIWNSTELDLNKVYSDVSDNFEPTGWVLLYGLPQGHDYSFDNDNKFIDSETADILWTFETENLTNIASPMFEFSENMVFVTTENGRLYALSKENGEKQWFKILGDKISEPCVFNDMVFVGSDKGLYAITENRDTKWSNMIGSIYSKPELADDSVITVTENGEFYAFDIDTGKEQWSYMFDTYESVVFSNSEKDRICAVSDNTCYLFDTEKGEIQWSFELDKPITASPCIYDNVVYVGSWDTYLYALDIETGEVLWKTITGWGVDTTPVISDDMVLFGSMDNSFYALNADSGEKEWTFNSMASIQSSPVVYGEYVFFGCDDGRFYALNKTTGDVAWVFTPGYSLQGDVYNYITTPVLSDPVVSNGTVVFGAQGVVYCLDTQTVEMLSESVKGDDDGTYVDAWLFILLALVVVVFVTVLYLIISKRKNK